MCLGDSFFEQQENGIIILNQVVLGDVTLFYTFTIGAIEVCFDGGRCQVESGT